MHYIFEGVCSGDAPGFWRKARLSTCQILSAVNGAELQRLHLLLISHLYISIFPPFDFRGAANIKFKHEAAAQLNFAKTR